MLTDLTFSSARVKAWSPIERLHIVNSMSVLDNTGRGGGRVFITPVTAVTLARHIPTKDSPIYSGPSRLRGIKGSQIEGPKKRKKGDTDGRMGAQDGTPAAHFYLALFI